MDATTQWYLDQLNSNPNTVMETEYGSKYVYTAEVGRVYTRIVQAHISGIDAHAYTTRSVHCFIRNGTGEVLKAAGWKSPAKGTRFVLPQDNDTVAKRMCFAGSYLYR